MIASVIVLLGFVMVMRGVRSQAPTDENAESLANRRFLIALVCMLVFSLVLLAHAHFLVATSLFVAAFTYLFADPEVPKQKRITSALINGVISSCVVYFLFQEIFLVRLP
jgi:multisubunit Na+/H+ antiporter MnhB subunit